MMVTIRTKFQSSGKYVSRVAVFLPALVACAILMNMCFTLIKGIRATKAWESSAGIPATVDAEMALTVAHGYEALTAIERYHMAFNSVEVYQQPEMLAEFITGPTLETWRARASFEPEGTYTVTASMTIERVRVLQFTPLRFIAIACGDVQYNDVSSDGEFIEENRPRGFKNIYVFVNEDDTWKIIKAYDIRDTRAFVRDIEHVGGWEQEYVGDLMDYFPRDHFCRF